MIKDRLNLVDLFENIQSPAQEDKGANFSALPIPGYEKHRLAKDSQGDPSLLISVADAVLRSRPTPIALEHVRIEHDVDCRILHPSGSFEQSQFTVIRCIDSDPALTAYFLRVAAPVLITLGPSPSNVDISQAISKLVELFKALTEPPRKSLRGLWAELFVIARSRDAANLILAWHFNPEDRYDFSWENQRIEVKGSSNRTHAHYFSLEQLTPPAGTELLVASVFVERSGSGISVVELAEQIRSRLSKFPDLLMRLDRNVGLILGNSWRAAIDERFDRELAETNLVFYQLGDIPRVDPNLPSSVSEVRFKSDLSQSKAADVEYYRSLGGLFRAVLKK